MLAFVVMLWSVDSSPTTACAPRFPMVSVGRHANPLSWTDARHESRTGATGSQEAWLDDDDDSDDRATSAECPPIVAIFASACDGLILRLWSHVTPQPATPFCALRC